MTPKRDPPHRRDDQPQTNASKPPGGERDAEKAGGAAFPIATQPPLVSPRRAKLLDAMYYWIHSR